MVAAFESRAATLYRNQQVVSLRRRSTWENAFHLISFHIHYSQSLPGCFLLPTVSTCLAQETGSSFCTHSYSILLLRQHAHEKYLKLFIFKTQVNLFPFSYMMYLLWCLKHLKGLNSFSCPAFCLLLSSFPKCLPTCGLAANTNSRVPHKPPFYQFVKDWKCPCCSLQKNMSIHSKLGIQWMDWTITNSMRVTQKIYMMRYEWLILYLNSRTL